MIRNEKTLLYVDDTVEQRYVMRRVLERQGYRVLEAGTGAEALAMLRPDLMLIILDVKLPDMSGYDVCRRIRQDAAYRSVPIIQVSASFADPERRAAGLSGGADAYVAQPVHPQELLSLVGSLIRSSHADRMLAFMAQIGPKISRSLELGETLAAVHGALAPYFADRSHVLLCDNDARGADAGLSHELQQLAEQVLAEDRAVLSGAENVPLSAIGAPLRAGGARLGVLLFVMEGSTRSYQDFDVVYAEDLADRVAMALQNAMLFTSQKQAQEALVRSEKLAAAARLSAAIAHELNNPLASVVNLTYLIETHPESPDEVKRYAAEALSELERLSHITRQTLGFYQELTAPEAFDLSETVRDTYGLYARRFAGKGITVEAGYAVELYVFAVRGEIRQVISNLLVNALDAMAEGGHLRIRSSRSAAGEAVLSIRDNGCGIAPAIQGRIFEPFFTTKRGTGTGLGLWVSESIVRKHGGRLEVESSDSGPQRGTTFRLILAAAAKGGHGAATGNLASA